MNSTILWMEMKMHYGKKEQLVSVTSLQKVTTVVLSVGGKVNKRGKPLVECHSPLVSQMLKIHVAWPVNDAGTRNVRHSSPLWHTTVLYMSRNTKLLIQNPWPFHLHSRNNVTEKRKE
ncbi:hypothetical protein BaRGS_00006944 [Batillaria attramentaria]|uniref:Uncharacterized protein n=1 Tax=Batillaria attramentaria TaxID=370345 RepID=A0ABD0LS31_9CAEN